MLLGITGAFSDLAARHYVAQGYTLINGSEVANIVSKWRDDFVSVFEGEVPKEIAKWPWFVHLHIENGSVLGTEKLQESCETKVKNLRAADVVVACVDEKTLSQKLETANVRDHELRRPSWDRYFMMMAELAASRSNCMKRRVGCVLVKDCRVLSTGYNGTPQNTLNCNEGGCARCNSGVGGGAGLETCLCLHAEENALMEAGAARARGAILFCNTCPCLTCSSKIIQCGLSEVVYSKEYSMDERSANLLRAGGVRLRKYAWP